MLTKFFFEILIKECLKNREAHLELPVSKILVIDDESDLREVLVDLLNAENFEVKEAECAKDALDLIDGGYQPSLILCDLNMPGMSGEDFIQNLVHRSNPSLVAVVSGFNDQERIIQCMNLGAADFLVKPLDHTELLDKVYLMIEIYKARLKSKVDPERARHYENLLKIRQGKLTRSRTAV